jgi:C1A family cysteine protease
MSNKEIDYESIPLNVLVEDPEFDKLAKVPDELFGPKGRSKSTSFPDTFTRKTVVPVFNQGSLGSCVGASGKVVVSDPSYSNLDLSTLWIYKRAQEYDVWAGNSYSGTSINGACIALKKEGICEEKFYPYTTDKTSTPKAGASENAQSRKIKDFYGISMRDDAISRIKELVMTHGALWTSFYVNQEFYNVGRDGFLRNEAGYIESTRKGGHAIALVGWTHKEGKLFWKFQNSWGNYWGDKGFFYMSEELYTKITKGFYCVQTDTQSEPIVNRTFFQRIVGIPLRMLDILKYMFMSTFGRLFK